VYEWNTSAGVLAAALPHLSTWNGDVPLPAAGGCITGRVVDACGAPVEGAQVDASVERQQHYGEPFYAFFSSSTGAFGNWCADLDRSGHSGVAFSVTSAGATTQGSWNGAILSCATCSGECSSDECGAEFADICGRCTEVGDLVLGGQGGKQPGERCNAATDLCCPRNGVPHVCDDALCVPTR
jgi:hypothetical protein